MPLDSVGGVYPYLTPATNALFVGADAAAVAQADEFLYNLSLIHI